MAASAAWVAAARTVIHSLAPRPRPKPYRRRQGPRPGAEDAGAWRVAGVTGALGPHTLNAVCARRS
jgi:hypothetical protein